MSTWILVWFVVALLSSLLLAGFAIGSVRQILIVGRAARQMQDEMQPLAGELRSESARASAKASSLQLPKVSRRQHS